MSNFLQPHGLQHTRLPCPSLSPGVCSNSCLLSQWFHPTISSSVTAFSLCYQSFPAAGSFPMSWLFPIGGRNIGASASASVLLMIFQGCFPVGLTGCISLLSKDSQESSPAPQFKKSIFRFSVFFMVQFSHPFVTTGKATALTIQTFVGKVISLLFNSLSRFVTAFLPRSKVSFNFMAAGTVFSDFGA